MTYPITWVKNTSGGTDTWVGQELADVEYYQIQDHERVQWSNDDKVLNDIASTNLTVCLDNSGTTDLSGTATQINQLKNSTIEISNLPKTASTSVTNAVEVVIHKPDVVSTELVTHDWTKKKTWYNKSVQVVDEILSDSGDGLTFNSANTFWIDLYHGNVYDEDTIMAATSNLYKVEIQIDDVLQDFEDGYTIDFDTGNVVFGSSQSGNVIKATYSYATTSEWVLKPNAGKTIIIEHSEIQFSVNSVLHSPIQFEIWAYDPNDPPNKIMYTAKKYKNGKDLIGTANQGQGYIPAFDNLSQNILVFPWNYVGVIPVNYSQGTELRVRIMDDQPYVGEYATGTFYISVKDE